MAFPSGFAAIQAAYAAHRVVTYPIREDKVPAVRGYSSIGAPASAQLALKFARAMAAGFCAGPRNKVTVVDIDSPDEKLVEEMQRLVGRSPLRIVTPSGGTHLYYRHDGEPRHIRLIPDVDILGVGNVVCAGSETPKGRYVIVWGSLDDLSRLPRLAGLGRPPQASEKVSRGNRNKGLFRHLCGIVGHCDDLDQLLHAARSFAADHFAEPLPDPELVKTCTSVWRFRGGRKLFMQHVIEGRRFAALIANPEVWTVCSYLMIENGPEAEFWIADGLAEARGWPRRMVPKARKTLLQLGIVKCIRPRGNGVPALYRWEQPT